MSDMPTRRAFVAMVAAAPLTGETPAPSTVESAFDLAQGSGTLFGTLAMPVATRQPPVVLIIAGSGPTDRDGNAGAVRTDTYRLLAVALAVRGIASVRYDKRGIGASRAALVSEATLRFEALLDDAVAWVAKMRSDGRFGAIAIAGHSEGSLLGMLAAPRAKIDAFISLEGAALPASRELRRQLAPRLANEPALAAASDRILEALERGQTTSDVPEALAALYRPSVQPYLISWFRYDPRVAIAKVSARTTIVQGTYDVQVPVDDAHALAAAKPNATLTIVERMSHVLKDAPDATLGSQINTVYANPSLPIDPAVPAAIAAAIGA